LCAKIKQTVRKLARGDVGEDRPARLGVFPAFRLEIAPVPDWCDRQADRQREDLEFIEQARKFIAEGFQIELWFSW
jgi:hypothetical protein